MICLLCRTLKASILRIAFYPMTSVNVIGKNGCWEICTQWPSFLWVIGWKQKPIPIQKSHGSQLGNFPEDRKPGPLGPWLNGSWSLIVVSLSWTHTYLNRCGLLVYSTIRLITTVTSALKTSCTWVCPRKSTLLKELLESNLTLCSFDGTNNIQNPVAYVTMFCDSTWDTDIMKHRQDDMSIWYHGMDAGQNDGRRNRSRCICARRSVRYPRCRIKCRYHFEFNTWQLTILNHFGDYHLV